MPPWTSCSPTPRSTLRTRARASAPRSCAACSTTFARGLRVVATCPFVRAFLSRHPDYQDVVADATTGWRPG